MHRWLIFRLVCALGLLGHASAAVLVGTPRVTPAGDGAEIRWATDVATGSRVQYGRSDNALTQRAEGEPGTDHTVVLRGLQPGTEYFYSVGTARVALATNAFVTAGVAVAPTSRETNRVPAAVPPPATTRPAPPARQTWGNMASLPDHYERHGRDFKAKDAEDYARQAWEFQQRARREKLPMKVDEDGVLRVYDPKTRAFAAYNRDGTTKTYFKPQSRDYFARQPGRIVAPAKQN